MSKLDPRIEVVRDKYGLERDDFWQIPQNKQWVCKHSALEIVAAKAGVEWNVPQVIEANTANGIAVLCVFGVLDERAEWATGEASPKNNRNSYPWAMAEKRAKDRVILKLVGIHGLVYSENELPSGNAQPPDDEKPKPASAAEQKRKLAEIDQDLLDCETIADVNKCARVWADIMKRDGWSKDYIDAAKPKFAVRREQIAEIDELPDESTDIKSNEYAQNLGAM